jgi:C-terminal processing protease CtpA/Prc
MKKDANRKYRMRYEGFPVIAAIRQGGAADKAKLQVGDRSIRVNYRSIAANAWTRVLFPSEARMRSTFRVMIPLAVVAAN